MFVCVHNSGRSQMAEAFFNYLARDKASATSAGTKPSSQVNSVVAEAMLEAGIDIRRQKPKALTLEMLEGADRVTNICERVVFGVTGKMEETGASTY